MSNFYNIHDNKEIIQEAISEYEVATEGWKSAVALFVPFLNIVVAGISLENVAKVTKEKVVRSYLKSEAEKTFKATKKTHPEVQKKIPSTVDYAEYESDMGLGDALKNLGKKMVYVDDWTFMAIGDTDHIEAVYLIMFDNYSDKILIRRIAAPTKKDITALGYKPQDEHNK